MSEIDKLEHERQVSVIGKVALDKPCPALFLGFCYLSVAIARQIRKLDIVNRIEVDSHRLARH